MASTFKGIRWLSGRKFDDSISVGVGRTENLADGSNAFAERTLKEDMMTVDPKPHPRYPGVVQGNGLWLLLEGGTVTQRFNLDDDVTVDHIWNFYHMVQEVAPERNSLWFNLCEDSDNPNPKQAFSTMIYDDQVSPRTLTLEFPGWDEATKHEYWSPFPMAEWTLDNSHSRVEFEDDKLFVCFTSLDGTNNSAYWDTYFRYLPAGQHFSFDKDSEHMKVLFSEDVILDNGKRLDKLVPYTLTSPTLSGEVAGGVACRALKAVK